MYSFKTRITFWLEDQNKNFKDRRFCFLTVDLFSRVVLRYPKPEGESSPRTEEHDASGWQPPLLTEQMSMSVHTLPSPWYPDDKSKSRA